MICFVALVLNIGFKSTIVNYSHTKVSPSLINKTMQVCQREAALLKPCNTLYGPIVKCEILLQILDVLFV